MVSVWRTRELGGRQGTFTAVSTIISTQLTLPRTMLFKFRWTSEVCILLRCKQVAPIGLATRLRYKNAEAHLFRWEQHIGWQQWAAPIGCDGVLGQHPRMGPFFIGFRKWESLVRLAKRHLRFQGAGIAWVVWHGPRASRLQPARVREC
jgi:hypothetical protein